jgi:hypothetical protein
MSRDTGLFRSNGPAGVSLINFETSKRKTFRHFSPVKLAYLWFWKKTNTLYHGNKPTEHDFLSKNHEGLNTVNGSRDQIIKCRPFYTLHLPFHVINLVCQFI